MKDKTKNIWSWIGIISLWLSGFWLIFDNPRQDNAITGLMIGQGSVFIMWAIHETIRKLFYNK